MVLSFYEQLYSTRIRHGEVNRLVWNLSKRMSFEVKTFYRALACQEVVSFPWKGIWRVKAPKRVAFFVWTAALGKILIHDNLHSRHIVMVEWCCMFKKNRESIDHLLLHCDVAQVVWCSFYSLFGVEWVMPKSVLNLLSGWGSLLGRGHITRLWKQVPLCDMWGLWRERNYRLWTCVKMCLICYMFGSWRIVRVVLCLLSFYIHVLLFPLIKCTFVYFMCIRVAPLCAFYLILLLIKKKKNS